jgi:hypothetical protein
MSIRFNTGYSVSLIALPMHHSWCLFFFLSLSIISMNLFYREKAYSSLYLEMLCYAQRCQPSTFNLESPVLKSSVNQHFPKINVNFHEFLWKIFIFFEIYIKKSFLLWVQPIGIVSLLYFTAFFTFTFCPVLS